MINKIKQKENTKSVTNNLNIVRGIYKQGFLISQTGKKYPVPDNYASKSKIIDGDGLELRPDEHLGLKFKTFDQVKRKTVCTKVIQVGKSFFIQNDNQRFALLPAAVSFFKLKNDDEIIAEIPYNNDGTSAAIISPVTTTT